MLVWAPLALHLWTPGHKSPNIVFPLTPRRLSPAHRAAIEGLSRAMLVTGRGLVTLLSLSSWDKPVFVLRAFLMQQPSSRQLQSPLPTPNCTLQRHRQWKPKLCMRAASCGVEGCWESPPALSTQGVPTPVCRCCRRKAQRCPVPLTCSPQEAWRGYASPLPPPYPLLC